MNTKEETLDLSEYILIYLIATKTESQENLISDFLTKDTTNFDSIYLSMKDVVNFEETIKNNPRHIYEIIRDLIRSGIEQFNPLLNDNVIFLKKAYYSFSEKNIVISYIKTPYFKPVSNWSK
jgi:uncharacterized membrane protein